MVQVLKGKDRGKKAKLLPCLGARAKRLSKAATWQSNTAVKHARTNKAVLSI